MTGDEQGERVVGLPEEAEVATGEGFRASRRVVMRMAALGTVTTAAYVGLSAVPAYASSASGDDGDDSIIINSVTSQATTKPLCLVKCCVTCWNTSGVQTQCAASTCNCGALPTNHKTCGVQSTDKLTGNLQVPKLSGPAINLYYELWGPTDTAGCTTQSPSLSLTISNIDPPFQHCDVSVTPTCNTGTPTGGGTVTNITTNGTVSITAPGCTGSLVGGPPAAAKCPDAASVEIKLSCYFD